MVFVVDSSGSIGDDHYEIMMQFIVKVCRSFNISREGVRVGLISFSDDSQIEFYLDKYTNSESVAEAIMSVEYQEGMTCTSDGLHDLNKLMKSQGRPAKTGVPRIAIVLTDGQ